MADTIAAQFIEIYYKTFDTNRQELLPLYVSHRLETYSPAWDLTQSFPDHQKPDSSLSWEGTPIQGAQAIVEKIVVRRSQYSMYFDGEN